LEFREIFRMQLVCREFNAVLGDDSLWLMAFRQRFGFDPVLGARADYRRMTQVFYKVSPKSPGIVDATMSLPSSLVEIEHGPGRGFWAATSCGSFGLFAKIDLSCAGPTYRGKSWRSLHSFAVSPAGDVMAVQANSRTAQVQMYLMDGSGGLDEYGLPEYEGSPKFVRLFVVAICGSSAAQDVVLIVAVV
jgi:hypothetical protein